MLDKARLSHAQPNEPGEGRRTPAQLSQHRAPPPAPVEDINRSELSTDAVPSCLRQVTEKLTRQFPVGPQEKIKPNTNRDTVWIWVFHFPSAKHTGIELPCSCSTLHVTREELSSGLQSQQQGNLPCKPQEGSGVHYSCFNLEFSTNCQGQTSYEVLQVELSRL